MQTSNTWFVLMGDQKYGPYDYQVLIQMLQANQLMDYNYVWAPHLESWTQVHQLEEFSKDRFQILLQKESAFLTAFAQRANPRKDIEVDLLGHNNVRFFDGKMVSVSEGGALCLFNTPLIQVGDYVKLHMKTHDGSPAFNIEGEVIRKNFSKQRLNSKSGLYYAIRFNDVQPVGLKMIRQWVQPKAG